MSYTVAIQINFAYVSDDLTDFPVYIDLSDLPDDFFNNCASDGGDIRVYTDIALTVQVPREIVSIDTSAKTGEMHVKLPSISSSNNTVFYVYCDGVSTEPAFSSTYGRNNVWSDYIAVYHLNEDPSGTSPQAIDSTGNSNDGSASGGMTSGDLIPGKLGKCIDFDGNDQFGSTYNSTLNTTNGLVIQSWGKTTSYPGVMAARDTSSLRSFQINVSNSGQVEFIAFSNSSYTALGGTTSVADGDFHKFDGVWDASTSGVAVYVDGATENTGSLAGVPKSGTTGLLIGSKGGAYYFTGQLDEIRYSESASIFTVDRIATEYANQNSPSTFYSLVTTPTTATPVLVPPGGAVAYGSTVAITCDTPGNTIYYTIDGTSPTSSSAVYSSPITVSSVMTIKAFATASGYDDSEIATGTYTLSDLALADMVMDIELAHQNFQTGWLDISIASQSLLFLPMDIILSSEMLRDASLDISLRDGLMSSDVGMDICLGDGNKTESLGLDLMAVSGTPELKAVYAMHLNSAIKEITA